jgi:hypothetical protein
VFSRDEDAYLTQIGTGANGKPLYDLVGNVPGGEVALDADGKPMSLRNVSQNGERFNGGDVIFRDTNHDGVIGDDDRFIIGRAQPKFFGGFNNSLSYGGFDLSFFFQYQYGNDVMNNMRRNLESMETENNQSVAVQRAWRKQGDETDMPKAVFRDPKGNARGSSTRWMEDGSYLRLKTVTLGYNLPESLLEADVHQVGPLLHHGAEPAHVHQVPRRGPRVYGRRHRGRHRLGHLPAAAHGHAWPQRRFLIPQSLNTQYPK